ncbi:MAG TPA: hypothetical protein K8V84_20125 [Nocardiopsis listeri]|uniref:hypothetical protein n=1 Tax=Nocardiopsis listeri TaxID=53440 RepID=UPI001DB576BE|nr:hypothetical protein [Nocardiopsis listeri]HJE60789.1 hypothetical protein [Nocardiopsis listeri]
MTNHLWSAERIGALGTLLRNTDPGKWTEADLSRMAVEQGWRWEAGEWGPILRTRSYGDAWLRPVDDSVEIHVTREEYVGLHFPLGRIDGGVREQVEAFHDAGRALRRALGEPNVIGSDDERPFHGESPHWGTPFLRWRRSEHSLDLRAGHEGPILCLVPTSPAEGWYWYEREHGGDMTAGFLGVSMTGDVGGMSIAGITRFDDWRSYARRLVDVFRTMPAELAALGHERSFGFHGRFPGEESGPWVFHFELGGYVRLGLDEVAANALRNSSEAPDPEEFGWVEATEERHLKMDVTHVSPSYRFDEVNAVRLAMLVLETAEALGIPTPEDLSLTDGGDTIPMPGGGWREAYQISDYGLGVTGNP